MLLLFLSAQARNLARAERNRSIHYMAEVRVLKPKPSARSPFEQWAAICMLSWASLNKLAVLVVSHKFGKTRVEWPVQHYGL